MTKITEFEYKLFCSHRLLIIDYYFLWPKDRETKEGNEIIGGGLKHLEVIEDFLPLVPILTVILKQIEEIWDLSLLVSKM